MKAVPFAFAAALVAVAVPTQAQTVEHQIRREPKLAYTMQQTPTFNVSGPKDKRVTPLEWLEVEVELDLETVRKSGFLDELTGTFYIALKDVETNKTIVLEDKITFIDVNARDKKAWLVAYVSPATLAKTLNKEKPSVNDIFAVAVSVSGPGIKEEATGTSPGSPKDWWKSTALTRKNGFILPKSKTVFAPLWGDRHPLTKD